MKKTITITLILLSAIIKSVAQNTPYTDKTYGGSSNGIVGKIKDELNVTPSGQLSYELPISTVTGTGGIAPTLTISYNSSTKNGLLGYGFDLMGLSIINRAPSNLHSDGKAGFVNFSGTDKFLLDGARLSKTSSSPNNSEYRTENNSFSKIVSSGTDPNPSVFTVYTKDGLIYDYTPSNKVLKSSTYGNALFWLVTKVSDTKGNYFTVTYDGDAANNDYWPTRIDYTGNIKGSLSPYASIRFSYGTNSYAPVTYIYGQKVKRSKFITRIEIFSGEKIIKYFKTSYYTVNYKKQLVSITEYASDGTHKNPTKFSWYNLENFKVTNVNYTRSSIIHKAMVTIGDFNGDGKADFIATPENRDAGWSGWKLFLSNGNSFYQAATGQFKLNGDIEQVVSGDFNGDGYDDIVIKRKFNDSYYDSDLYLSKVSATGISFLFSKCFLATQNKYTIQSVELNGDGAADIFAWYENSKKCDIIYSVSSSSSITPLGYKATRNCSVNFDRVEYGDFNGDGLTDVMNLDNNGYYLLQSDGYGTMSQVDSGKWPEKRHYINFGDFNGDGKTDLMLTGWENDPNKDGWTNWCLLSFKGNGDFV